MTEIFFSRTDIPAGWCDIHSCVGGHDTLSGQLFYRYSIRKNKSDFFKNNPFSVRVFRSATASCL